MSGRTVFRRVASCLLAALAMVTVSVLTNPDAGSVALTAGNTCPAPHAAPGHRARLHHACQFNRDYPKLVITASRWTGWGQMTIKGVHRTGSNRWQADKPTLSYRPPVYADVPRAAGAATLRVPGGNCPPHHVCWWAPSSWQWKHIFGKFWDDIFLPCYEGVKRGLVATVGIPTVANILGYTVASSSMLMEITPVGLFGAAFFNCSVGIWHH